VPVKDYRHRKAIRSLGHLATNTHECTFTTIHVANGGWARRVCHLESRAVNSPSHNAADCIVPI
jgi:hypothetical protein